MKWLKFKLLSYGWGTDEIASGRVPGYHVNGFQIMLGKILWTVGFKIPGW